MNIMAGQPDSATQQEMRRHLNPDGRTPGGAPPPPPSPSPPPPWSAPRPDGAPRPAGIPPPRRPPPRPSPGGAPLRRGPPPCHQGASSHYSPPVNEGSDSHNDDSESPRPIVRRGLYGGPGSTSPTSGTGTRGLLGGLLDKQIWLGVWVLLWEIEVGVRKGMLEMPRKTMIPGMWVLEGVAAVVSRVVAAVVGGSPGHPAATGPSWA